MLDIRVRMINYQPSFNGKHNATRCKAWLVLYDRLARGKRGLTLKELALFTGLGYKSISASIPRWIRWRYVGYRTTPSGRIYRLRKRGKEWLERWQNIMPLEKYIQEIEDAQEAKKSGERT